MDLVGVLIVIITSVWVLIDAKKIGIRKGQVKGFFNLGPWGWFLFSILFWIIGFPCYFIKRPEYKRINGNETGSAVATAIGWALVLIQIVIIVVQFS